MAVILKNGFTCHTTQIVPADEPKLTSILVLNLMPDKQTTEAQLLSLCAELDEPISLTFMYTKTHHWRHGDQGKLAETYVSLDDVKDQHFNGLLVTGAPVETIPFEAVDYWDEFKAIRDWATEHTDYQLFTCWAAQAALYTDFNIPKVDLTHKIFGVYENQLATTELPQWFQIPQSRFSRVDRKVVANASGLDVLGDNEITGPFLLQGADKHSLYVLGHPEYGQDTLSGEYYRDLQKGISVQKPINISLTAPQLSYAHWRSCSRYLYESWIKQSFISKEKSYL